MGGNKAVNRVKASEPLSNTWEPAALKAHMVAVYGLAVKKKKKIRVLYLCAQLEKQKSNNEEKTLKAYRYRVHLQACRDLVLLLAIFLSLKGSEQAITEMYLAMDASRRPAVFYTPTRREK